MTMTNDFEVRDHLASERTSLANERTLLAYIRTALACIIAGVGELNLLSAIVWHGVSWALISLGVFFGLFGFRRFLHVRKRIHRVAAVERKISLE